MLTVLSAIVVLGVLIFIHETGHFVAAKLFRIRVERFSMGYPPRLFGKKIGYTDYCISAIPFGGYVKIAGMVDESMDKEALKKEPQPWEYRSKPWFPRMLVIFAGPFMNIFFAFLVYMGATYWYGVPEIEGPIIDTLIEGQPAETAGMLPGDVIVDVDGTAISSWDTLQAIVHASPEKPLSITWQRGDSLITREIVPALEQVVDRGDIKHVGLIGISPTIQYRRATFAEGVTYGGVTTFNITRLILTSLGKLITGRESVKSLAGPVLIAKMAGDSIRSGLSSFIGFMAFLSLNLGILNLLPIPVLDGGHLGYLVIEGITRRTIPVKIKLVIQQIGMVLILGLMIFVVYNDIIRLFQK